MHADRWRWITDREATDGSEEPRIDRVRRVSREACADAPTVRGRGQLLLRPLHQSLWLVSMKANQLVEHESSQGGAGEPIEGHQRVADVAHDRRAGCDCLGERRIDGV